MTSRAKVLFNLDRDLGYIYVERNRTLDLVNHLSESFSSDGADYEFNLVSTIDEGKSKLYILEIGYWKNDSEKDRFYAQMRLIQDGVTYFDVKDIKLVEKQGDSWVEGEQPVAPPPATKEEIIEEIHDQCRAGGVGDVAVFGCTVTLEEQEGGGEGQGEYCHFIFKVEHPTLGTFYAMQVGDYQSYDGINIYDDAKEVVPYEKTVRAWKDA
jgi:hypothetical protein